MKKFRKTFLPTLLLICLLLGLLPSNVNADQADFIVPAKAALAVDANSGKILYQQNAQTQLGIASITKILTVYLVYQAIDQGKISLTTKCPISDYAYSLSQDTDLSGFPLTKGEEFTVKDLLAAALIPSSNAAAVILAEKIAGSEAKFVDSMQDQLKTWGISGQKIVNATGLPNSLVNSQYWYPETSQDDENLMSATDLALIAIHLLKDYPQVLDITKSSSWVFDDGGKSQTTLTNTNYLLPNSKAGREGVDGLKTGSTTLAGDSFLGTINYNHFRIITVVLNADNPDGGEMARFDATNTLINQVYAGWHLYSIAIKGEKLKEYKKSTVRDGVKSTVSVVSKDNLDIVAPLGNPSYQTSFKQMENVKAPIKKGQPLVTVWIHLSDPLGYLPGYKGTSMDLVAQKSVKGANPLAILWNQMVRFINDQL